jgi:hypothetical protein
MRRNKYRHRPFIRQYKRLCQFLYIFLSFLLGMEAWILAYWTGLDTNLGTKCVSTENLPVIQRLCLKM